MGFFCKLFIFVLILKSLFDITRIIINASQKEIRSESLAYKLKIRNEFLDSSNSFLVRDFFYHNCKDRRRIGGRTKPLDKLQRIDGSWFVCFDQKLAPVYNNCNILSFGINDDESFDLDMVNNYGCNVHSFDPFQEADRFSFIREKNPKLKNSFMIPLNDKWKFYRIGITGSVNLVKNRNRIGWIETLENILKLTNLKNKIIDVFKIDIEIGTPKGIVGCEKSVLENLDIDYACKYFKQFLIETHPSDLRTTIWFDLLKKLDKCFSLFHRDTRFIGPHYIGEVFKDVAKSGFKVNLDYFQDEVSLSNFLLSTGELYFINENFL